MTLTSKEHHELMEQFEREFRYRRVDREPKAIWPQGNVYQDGVTNELFLAYRRGYALARAVLA